MIAHKIARGRPGHGVNFVVTQSAPIFRPLASEDKSLLVGWNVLLILDFCLHVVDGVRRFDLQCDRHARDRLDEDLYAVAKAKDQMESGLLLDVVV